MPVNKLIGKLWFETQEEIDRYDDLMVSNIELKHPDSENPNFAVISLRERKEIVPGLTEKSKEDIKKYLNFMQNAKPTRSSNTSYWEWPIHKMMISTTAGYFVLRELPIRNFYARSVIMGAYMIHLLSIFSFRGQGYAVNSPWAINYNHDYMSDYKEKIRSLRSCEGFETRSG